MLMNNYIYEYFTIYQVFSCVAICLILTENLWDRFEPHFQVKKHMSLNVLPKVMQKACSWIKSGTPVVWLQAQCSP